MNAEDRFADTGAVLSDYATHFIVHCPKCNGKTLIALVNETWKLTCTSCHHVEIAGHWYGALTAYASVKCRDCNTSLQRSAPSDGKWKKILLKCDQCGDECEYEAHFTKHPLNHGLMTDPVFGLPLWLQQQFRDEIFWSYNNDHIEMLAEFIGAKLRERGISPRSTIRKNSSMISRLPGFISKAKNRTELLKLIKGLQLKA